MKKIIAAILSCVLLLGTLALGISADTIKIIYKIDENTKKETEEIDYENTLKQYLTAKFESPEEKLEAMELMYEKDGYQLWVDKLTGEVATKSLASGQILFSNPYDVSTSGSDSIKKQLLSQVIIKYLDNDTEKFMYSFEESAQRGQIKFKNIKNGIRVEYTIGREENRMLVPKRILRERFESMILDVYADEINARTRELAANGVINKNLCIERDGKYYDVQTFAELDAPILVKEVDWHNYDSESLYTKILTDSGNDDWFMFNKLRANYQRKALSECATQSLKDELILLYPICKENDIYVYAPDATLTETMQIEGLIKTFCPKYTYEELDKDHAATDYEGQDKAPALFKMAIEYTLDKWGVTARIPVNGLRFTESLYKLTYISPLPYMGAGANYLLDKKTETFTGYNFFPDGSGTLFRHENLTGKGATNINGKVYGQDFAYHTITGTHQEIVRYPVFGIVSNYHEFRTEEKTVTPAEIDSNGITITPAVTEKVDVRYNEDRGFVAIIEEGDALAELQTNHPGTTHKYNSVQMLFYPRPRDTMNLANVISVGSNAPWTVVSSRKYVGNYKIRYIMLTDEAIAAEKGISDYYAPTWLGMAKAYRDYLVEKGDLTALKEENIKPDIPLFIQTFGTLETVEKILSIPVNVMTPLTTFDNIKTMYDELAAEGVSNIKFRLTGYANGGMDHRAPYNLEWEKSVGGKDGYNDLINYANDKGFGVFPDFDFVYVNAGQDGLFDGLSLKAHAARTINDQYTSKRYYSATQQTFFGRFELAVSPAYFDHFYSKLSNNLKAYYENGIPSGISVSTLGTDLNSDFDEDEPYNRADSQEFTTDLFKKLDNDFSEVMTDGANAFTWKYIDYIMNAPLDSSRYIKSSNAVPFIGVVLHGYKQMAGTPINMDGNIGYSFLKAIENGAGLNFTLCFQNYEKLKEDNRLSQYYSVRYDILKDDVIKYYTKLNDLTRELQLSTIVGHEFLIGERIPDADEVAADLKALEDAAIAEKELEEAKLKEELRKQALAGRIDAVETAQNALNTITASYSGSGAINPSTGLPDTGLFGQFDSVKLYVEQYKQSLIDVEAYTALSEALAETAKAKAEVLAEKRTAYNDAKTVMSSAANAEHDKLVKAVENAQKLYDTALTTFEQRKEAYDPAAAKVDANMLKLVDEYEKAYNAYYDAATKTTELTQAFSNCGTAIKNADPTFYNIVYQYIAAKWGVGNRLAGLNAAIESEKTGAGKAQYDADNAVFLAAEAEYNAASEASLAASKEKSDTDKLLAGAVTTQSQSKRYLNSQVQNINSVMKKIENQKASANKAAENSAYAAELLIPDPQYSEVFKADVKDAKEKTAALSSEVNKLFADVEKLVNECYDVASEVIEIKFGSSTTVNPGDTQTEEDNEYKVTKYTDKSGNIVKVTYDNGTFFILNYNFYDVTVVDGETQYTIARNGGVKVTSDNVVTSFDSNK